MKQNGTDIAHVSVVVEIHEEHDQQFICRRRTSTLTRARRPGTRSSQRAHDRPIAHAPTRLASDGEPVATRRPPALPQCER
eukprot:5044813-Lingulodinium_polyedra.AAC.1